MSRINDVFRTLVTKGNKGLLTAGKGVGELTVGQLGVFDTATNTSITNVTNKDFYFAVGVDTTGGNVVNHIATSTIIKAKDKVYSTLKKYQAPIPAKVVIKDYLADCSSEYGLKININNGETTQIFGYNMFSKTFMVRTAECNNCAVGTCPSADANEVTKLLYQAILNDTDDLIIPRIKLRNGAGSTGITDTGNGITLANVDTLITFNKTKTNLSEKLFTNLELEIKPSKAGKTNSVKANYNYPRISSVTVSLIEAFKNNGTVDYTVKPVYEQNSGYDIRELEYQSAGITQTPYRESGICGIEFEPILVADVKTNYDLYVYSYDNASKGGMLDYRHNQATYIAVPTTDNTTITALAALGF